MTPGHHDRSCVPFCSCFCFMPLMLLIPFCVRYKGPTLCSGRKAASVTLKNRGHEACWTRAVGHSYNSRPVDPEPYGSRMTPLGNDLWPSSSLLCILMLLFLLHAAHAVDAAHDAYTICLSYGGPILCSRVGSLINHFENRGHEACWPRAVGLA